MAPFDFLVADEQLSTEQVAAAHQDCHMWTADGHYPLLPWSSCVLESVAWEAAPNFAPYSSVKPAS